MIGSPQQKLSGKVHLERVRLDNGGYDSTGKYWGVGQPLYRAYDDLDNDSYFRADNRDAAKQHETLKGCRFYR